MRERENERENERQRQSYRVTKNEGVKNEKTPVECAFVRQCDCLLFAFMPLHNTPAKPRGP
jgi:hypothetical protein